MRRYFIDVLVIFGLLALYSLSLADDGKWTKKADMPNARNWHSACQVGGKIYVFGGLPQNNLVAVEEYDPVKDKWTRKSDMPIGRDSFSVEVVNGKVYVIGGEDAAWMPLSSMYEYDPTTDKWTKKADMLVKRRDFTTSMINGKIYALGGAGEAGGTATVEEYDPVIDEWSMKNNMPNVRCFLRASSLNGKIYAIGGDTSANPNAPSKTVEEYDPIIDKWTKKADLSTARMNHTACSLNGKIYVIGGSASAWVADWGDGIASVEEYDPKKDRWIKKADMPTARLALSATVVNGKIYAIGGSPRGGVGLITPAVEEFVPESRLSVSHKDKLSTTWGSMKSSR